MGVVSLPLPLTSHKQKPPGSTSPLNMSNPPETAWWLQELKKKIIKDYYPPVNKNTDNMNLLGTKATFEAGTFDKKYQKLSSKYAHQQVQ